VARTGTERRREAVTLRQGRFARGSTGQRQAPRRSARSASDTQSARRFGRPSGRSRPGTPRKFRRQPQQTGAQRLMQEVRGFLPGGGGSAKKGGKRSGGWASGIGDRLGSLRASDGRRGKRGRKGALFGLLGAGAAGAAAAAAKRRQGSGAQPPAGSDLSEPQETSTATSAPASTAASAPAHEADPSAPAETARGSDSPVGDDAVQARDERAAGDDPAAGDDRS
jgi:hypothetical protein